MRSENDKFKKLHVYMVSDLNWNFEPSQITVLSVQHISMQIYVVI